MFRRVIGILAVGVMWASVVQAASQGDSDFLRAKALKDSDPLQVMKPARAESYARGRSYAPQQMSVIYDLYRNGQKLGRVTDMFTRTGNRYQIVSEARAVGPLKFLWLGNIRLESRGEVGENGLRPLSFRHIRSDQPAKAASAGFDWKQRTVSYQYKGKMHQDTGLKDGTQDQLSQLYQFVFLSSLPVNYSLDVVSGKGTNDYRYSRRDGGQIKVPAGQFAVQEFDRIMGPGDEKAITVWVAPGHNNLPVQIRVTEEGTTLEQRLVRFTFKP